MERARIGRPMWAALLFIAAAVAPPVSAVTLEDAVRMALATNPEVSGAEAEMRAAGQEIKQARAGYFPSLDLDGRVGREKSNIKQLRRNGLDDRYLTPREFGVTVRQMVFDGLATPSEVARRVALLESASGRALDVRESVAFRTATAFLDVVKIRQLVAYARENVEAHRDLLARVQRRVRRGISRRADEQQATGRMALAQSVLTAREGSLREAENAYKRIVGEYPTELAVPQARSSPVLEGGKLDPDRLRSSIDEATAAAIAQHPALRAALAEVKAGEAGVRASRAGYMPRVDLELNVSRDANISGVEGVRNADSVGVVTRWNLFRGGADRAREKAAAERTVAAMDAAADTRRAIEESVATAVQAKATSEQRLTFLNAHVTASEATLTSYKAQLKLGRRTLLDTLNTVNELFAARSNLVSGEFDDLTNQYFIEAAKGSLVSSLGIAEPE